MRSCGPLNLSSKDVAIYRGFAPPEVARMHDGDKDALSYYCFRKAEECGSSLHIAEYLGNHLKHANTVPETLGATLSGSRGHYE